MLKQFFKDSAIYGLSTIFSRGLAVILVPLYTRLFSPTDFGIIDLLAVAASLINVSVALEISQGVARYFSDASGEDKVRYASTALWFTLAMYSIFLVVSLPFGAFLSGWILQSTQHAVLIQIALCSIWCNGMFYFLQQQLRWLLQPKAFGIASILYTAFSIGVTLFCVLVLRTGVVGVFIGNCSGGVAGILFAWYSARQSYRILFDGKKCKEMLSFSAPLIPSSLGVFAATYVDRILINKLMTLNEVGLYGIGYRFASLVSLLMVGFQGALTPLIYQHYRDPKTPSELARIFRYFLVPVLVLILGLGLFSREILLIFTVPAYYSAAHLIPILASAIVCSQMYIFAPGLALAKRTKAIAVINVAAALLNAILNLVLIPLLGILGSALATLVSAFLTLVVYMVLSQNNYLIPHNWKAVSLSAILILILLAAGVPIQAVSLLSISLKAALMVVGGLVSAFILIGPDSIRSILSTLKIKWGL